MICHYFSEPTLFFFLSDVPKLLYYSHIPATLIALILGFFVFINAPKRLLNQLLLAISLCFATWSTINLVAWTNIHSDFILFAWTFFGVLSALISILSIYLVNVFVTGKDVSTLTKWIFLILLTPVLSLAHTNLSLSGFNISDCDAFGYEGQLFMAYYTILGVIAMVWILVLLIKYYPIVNQKKRTQMIYMGVGIELFLFGFFLIVWLASYMADIGLVDDSRLEFYGLFGMTFFMTLVAVLIVKFKAFNVNLSASVALISALLILKISQYTYVTSLTNQILTTISLALTIVIGYYLIVSIRNEIKQKQEIAALAARLERANLRLKELDKLKSEFVSVASHQMRSPLTAIRGYTSLLLDGSYGKLPAKSVEPLERISESSRLMANAIEDYLNVSRIESGNMNYHLADFNLYEHIDKICDDLRPIALKKGLILLFRTDLDSKAVVHADVGKTQQIIHNLINNSIKYTNKGSITVFLHDRKKNGRVSLEIIDTGVGMSEESLSKIFNKFQRADGAEQVNTTGTGLGLYVAKRMAEAMGGTITASSEGEGKGSKFTLELPLCL